MAHGAPDYWTATIGSKSILSPDQTAWYQYGTAFVLGGAFATLVNYVVPAGQQLLIADGFVGCDSPCLHQVWIIINGVIQYSDRFSLRVDVPLNPDAPIVAIPGPGVNLQILNGDNQNINFYGALYGFLKPL